MDKATAEAWANFRNTGLLWFINRMLHVWGIAIEYEMDGDRVISVRPELVDYLGFDRETEVSGFLKLRGYTALVGKELFEDIAEETFYDTEDEVTDS